MCSVPILFWSVPKRRHGPNIIHVFYFWCCFKMVPDIPFLMKGQYFAGYTNNIKPKKCVFDVTYLVTSQHKCLWPDVLNIYKKGKKLTHNSKGSLNSLPKNFTLLKGCTVNEKYNTYLSQNSVNTTFSIWGMAPWRLGYVHKII